MRLLFTIDTKDYDPKGVAFVRPSARCVTIRYGSVAMVYSKKYDYYKFPGGGLENGETEPEAMIREAREEAGLVVIPESVRPYGTVRRIQKSDHPGNDYFVQDNYYYLCQTQKRVISQNLDDYERQEGFTLTYVAPETAIAVNRRHDHGPKDRQMLEREAKVLELLMAEGYFDGTAPKLP